MATQIPLGQTKKQIVYTNATWQHKNKIVTKILHEATNKTWRQKYNMAPKIQHGHANTVVACSLQGACTET